LEDVCRHEVQRKVALDDATPRYSFQDLNTHAVLLLLPRTPFLEIVNDTRRIYTLDVLRVEIYVHTNVVEELVLES